MHKPKYKMHSSPAQLANLRPFNKMSKEEHMELSRRGGKVGGESHTARAKKRQTFREAVEFIAGLPAFKTDDELVEKIRAQYPDLDNTEAMAIAVVKRVVTEGDSRAFATLRDTTGELPVQTVNLQNQEPMSINIQVIE